MLIAELVHVIIGLYVLILVLRMFVSRRDAYFNPLFSGVYRATDPVMEPVRKAFRRKGPVDISGGDYLVLAPIAFLVALDGIVAGLLVDPRVGIIRGFLFTLYRYADAAFLLLVILILVFSVFYRFTRFPANPFLRAGFNMIKPVYIFVARVFRPLKERPGISAFFLGLLLHFLLGVLIISAVGAGDKYFTEHPGAVARMAIGHSLGELLWLATFFTWVIIIGALMSWVSPDPNNPVVQLVRLLSEPVNRPFRKVIPDIGGIDISPIFSIIALQVAAQAGGRLIAIVFKLPSL